MLSPIHGYAHGAEIPGGADATAFSAGFALAAELPLLGGIGLGATFWWAPGHAIVWLAGTTIAAAGLVFLTATL
jgi:urease accessory protein